MNTFVQAVNEVQLETRSLNGMKTFDSSKSPLVDLFFAIGASRGKGLSAEFVRAFKYNETYALRLLMWARDVRGGAGERVVRSRAGHGVGAGGQREGQGRGCGRRGDWPGRGQADGAGVNSHTSQDQLQRHKIGGGVGFVDRVVFRDGGFVLQQRLGVVKLRGRCVGQRHHGVVGDLPLVHACLDLGQNKFESH